MRVRCPFYLSFAVDEMLPKLFTEPGHGGISNARRITILLKPLFLFIEVLTLLELSPDLRKPWKVALLSRLPHYFDHRMV